MIGAHASPRPRGPAGHTTLSPALAGPVPRPLACPARRVVLVTPRPAQHGSRSADILSSASGVLMVPHADSAGRVEQPSATLDGEG